MIPITRHRFGKKKMLALVIIAILLVSLMPAMAFATNAWAPGVLYQVGDLVTYNGSTYQCIQAHTSLVGWEPPNTSSIMEIGGQCSNRHSAAYSTIKSRFYWNNL